MTHAATAGAVLWILMFAAGAAWPQVAPSSSPGVQAPAQQAVPDQPAPSQAEPAPVAPPSPPRENPGLLNEVGKLLDKSLSALPTLKSPSETIDELNARAKDAGDALSRLAKPSMATGRMKCPVSANGAPDCKVAADQLCQTKGLKEGKSLEINSAESCSPKVLIPGRARKPDDCRTENYVIHALCQ